MTKRKRGQLSKPPLMLRIPPGLRDRPAWVFIGFMTFVGGISYVAGFAESTISTAVTKNGLRVWGAVFAIAGLGLMLATMKAKPALEKLALRVFSASLLVYGGWLLVVVPIQKAMIPVIYVFLLAVVAELRRWGVTHMINTAVAISQQVNNREP